MNNEFQWRSEMRKLDGAVEPARDLWPDLAARIGAQRMPRRMPRIGFAIAATAMLACGAGLIAQRLQSRAQSVVALTQQASADTVVPRTPLDWATPANPALAAAAEDLDGASAQLQQALEQQPDAVFLVGMLNRTNGQRMRLLQQAPYAG
ncbi:MAG: hypothetical protein P4L92_13480 [Rudaea sp.]|nr:hypothetical protein [Rudaea sp.]